MNEYIGWLGSFLFAVCALPQVIQTFRTKKSDDLNSLFLLMWFLGEVFTLWYIVMEDFLNNIRHYPLYFNYIFNLLLLSYLLFAKYKYRSA
ncbi:MAG: PQ-loop repeat-containing protein [Chitinophagales bacterium]|nr:PQ-loop repeat-containing protein [Chitinophagales bacterium]